MKKLRIRDKKKKYPTNPVGFYTQADAYLTGEESEKDEVGGGLPPH
jgi:hypothetical protein